MKSSKRTSSSKRRSSKRSSTTEKFRNRHFRVTLKMIPIEINWSNEKSMQDKEIHIDLEKHMDRVVETVTDSLSWLGASNYMFDFQNNTVTFDMNIKDSAYKQIHIPQTTESSGRKFAKYIFDTFMKKADDTWMKGDVYVYENAETTGELVYISFKFINAKII